ncbi:putative ribosomal protein [Streptococcus acidominimus]|uniref:Putative ribosomal protein n=1 Tax=Streptococcus acidominimus TaxID=1326 RepID=A0A239X8Q4_STRAI|nr:OsmC family protein [Streptococcus acidominimus]SNV42969.1 putative ribosomal protein [Streptococcus acidominimus]
MYQTKVKGDKLYHTVSEGYGQSVELFGFTKDGETPMSLVNIALAACVTMCVQGYFARFHQETVLASLVDSTYDEGNFKVTISVAHKLDEDMKVAILAYIDEQCRVKKILREDLIYDISLEEAYDI